MVFAQHAGSLYHGPSFIHIIMKQPFFILAPMRGITNFHYRETFVRHFLGVDAAMAPFIPTVVADRIHPKLLKDVLPEQNTGLALIPQLIGNRADDVVHMTSALYDLGYEEVNLNMGCPHKPIRRKQRGSGLLPHPERVDALLDTICSRSPCRISVKVRLGVSGNSELIRLIPVLNRYPLSEVIIHPRTAEQMYNGHVDLDAFETAFNALTVPVCYNGDINDATFFLQVHNRFPEITRFMLGRGLLANPFLCEEIKALQPGGSDKHIGRIEAFHDMLLARYETTLHGDHPVLGKMKEFWTYQSTHLTNGRQLFKKLKKSQRLSTYKAIVHEFLAEAEWNA